MMYTNADKGTPQFTLFLIFVPALLPNGTCIGDVSVEDGDVELQTARNDLLINGFNRIRFSGWWANVDMQYSVSRQKVISYCAKLLSVSLVPSTAVECICNWNGREAGIE